MFCYLSYIGNYNSISAKLYQVFEEQYQAEEMGERLKQDGGCDYYYVQRDNSWRKYYINLLYFEAEVSAYS